MAIKELKANKPQEPISMKIRLAIIICTWCKAKYIIKVSPKEGACISRISSNSVDQNPQNQDENLDMLCSEFVKIYQEPEEAMAEERFEVLLPDLYKFLEENSVEIDYVTSQIERL